jgi:hypothetical protein
MDNKNEDLPSSISKYFIAHKDGQCIEYSPCGSYLVTAGSNEVRSWKEEICGSEYSMS